MVTQCDKQFNAALLIFENCINTFPARGDTFHGAYPKSPDPEADATLHIQNILRVPGAGRSGKDDKMKPSPAAPASAGYDWRR
jgi:hypothetical protein